MKLSKTSSNTQHFYQEELKKLKEAGNLRTLPEVIHDGKWVLSGEQRMLNLSSNDYLGLATDTALRDEFLGSADNRDLLFSSSSSRLLTGNFHIYTQLERLLADLFGTESALTFGSGYHMNSRHSARHHGQPDTHSGRQARSCQYHRRYPVIQWIQHPLPSSRLPHSGNTDPEIITKITAGSSL